MPADRAEVAVRSVSCPRCGGYARCREILGWRRNLLECLACGWRWIA